MGNLGNVLINLGAYPSAKTYLEKALKIHAQHYSTTHLHTARTMGNLGIVFYHLEQYEKARKCYQQNIKFFTEHYGVTHAETKRVKRNLAILEEQFASKSNQKQPKSALQNPNDENDDIFDID